MQSVSRRHLLALAAGSAVAIPLAACSTTGGLSNLASQQVIVALQAVATEISHVLPQLAQVPGFAGNVLTSAGAIIADIQLALQGIGTATTQAQGQNILIQVEDYLNQLAPIILPFISLIPGVGQVGTVIGMIVAALPAIEALAGVVVTAISSVTAGLAATAPAAPASSKYRGATSDSSLAYLVLLEQRAAASRASRRYHIR